MDATPTGILGAHGAVKALMHELEMDGRNGRKDSSQDRVATCCECAHCRPGPTTAQCRCTHPSSEFTDGVMFSGTPACTAFVPRHGRRHGLFDGQGGISWLHGS